MHGEEETIMTQHPQQTTPTPEDRQQQDTGGFLNPQPEPPGISFPVAIVLPGNVAIAPTPVAPATRPVHPEPR